MGCIDNFYLYSQNLYHTLILVPLYRYTFFCSFFNRWVFRWVGFVLAISIYRLKIYITLQCWHHCTNRYASVLYFLIIFNDICPKIGALDNGHVKPCGYMYIVGAKNSIEPCEQLWEYAKHLSPRTSDKELSNKSKVGQQQSQSVCSEY